MFSLKLILKTIQFRPMFSIPLVFSEEFFFFCACRRCSKGLAVVTGKYSRIVTQIQEHISEYQCTSLSRIFSCENNISSTAQCSWWHNKILNYFKTVVVNLLFSLLCDNMEADHK